MTHSTKVVLDGSQAALLLAVVFSLDHWDFERGTARRFIPKASRNCIRELHDSLWNQWTECLEFNQLLHPKGPRMTPDMIRQRGKLVCEFELTFDEIELCLGGLRACAEEFHGEWGWQEMCSAFPGALNWYENLDSTSLGSLTELLSTARGKREDHDPEHPNQG